MYYGRKPCDLQIRKDQYLNHLKKIKQLKSSNSPIHKSIIKQQQHIGRLIRASHKKHNETLRMEWKKRQLTQIQTNRKSYDNIKSIVKKEVNRKLLTIPQKHKPNTYFIQIENMKLVDKILTVRSQFNFKQSPTLSKTLRNKSKPDLKEDYSNIYQRSMIKQIKKRRINLKLDKFQGNIKMVLNFLDHQNFNLFKSRNPFIIMLESDDKIKKSKEYQLEQILSSSLCISAPPKPLSINFLQRIGDRFLKRFKIHFTEEQLNESQKLWITKSIQDSKDKAIGLIEIELKRKEKKNKIKYPYSSINHQNGKQTLPTQKYHQNTQN